MDAIDHPELRDYYDVIIFSTEGERTLASLLAGGGQYPGFFCPASIDQVLLTRL